ncbi:hypothetical protein [Lysobacter gummosus]|uniref:hypothetical protein n=1 Tax=Lysobacter gummosus TaxID=262324 RepID=UPI00364483D9
MVRGYCGGYDCCCCTCSCSCCCCCCCCCCRDFALALLCRCCCCCWAQLITRETRDTRRAAHMDVRRVPPWAGCPLRDLPASASHSWLLTRNS